MTRFYQINRTGQKPKFYKNLKDLCEIEGLNYSRVYNVIGSGRKGGDAYIDEPTPGQISVSVQKWTFEVKPKPADNG